MNKISIVIVDDNPIIRTSLRNFLSLEEDMVVLGEAEGGEQALYFLEDLAPDILLLDMEMPGLNGLQVTAQIRARGSPVIILIVSALLDPVHIHRVLNNGAAGYISKDELPELLFQAIREVAGGKKEWLSPQVRAVR